MRTCALLCLLATAAAAAPAVSTGTAAAAPAVSSAAAPTPVPGSLDSSKIRLDAGDAAGALNDAEQVLTKGGSADAYAARGDARRALGRPFEEVLSDYQQAATLDPRYIEKYKGLLAQAESERHPKGGKDAKQGLMGIPMGYIMGAGLAGGLLIVGGIIMAKRREGKAVAPDDEEVKPAGNKKASSEPEQKA